MTAAARLVTLLCCLLCGCGVNDHFGERVVRFDRSVEAARNDMVLTNIIRAQLNYPLSFVSVPTLHGSQTLGASAGLPTITIGPGQNTTQHQNVFGPNTLTATDTSSFDMSVLDSKEFYRALLTPLGIDIAHFFAAQGYSREILFYLLVDHMIIRGQSGRRELYNDPRSDGFDEFKNYAGRFYKLGLTTELVEHEKGARSARLCFTSALATLPSRSARPECGSPAGSLAPASFRVADERGQESVELVLRSTQGIFYYLGHLLDAGTDRQVHVLTTENGTSDPETNSLLLYIEKGSSSVDDCFASTSYAGETYCVPSRTARNTTRVMGLLVQLLALSTSLSDLPLTTTVRVTE